MELRTVDGDAYAGVGSRQTPALILQRMRRMAALMGEAGWVLRSGAAPGADSAFELGCDDALARKEIWLPWLGFRGHSSLLTPRKEAHEIAAAHHPNWPACDSNARCLHARNVCQVLGANLESPVKLVICWTDMGLGGGGTGQAIRIARAYKIPVYDLGIRGTGELLARALR